MKNIYTISFTAAILLLIGAGCAPTAPISDLPTEPPVMMEQGQDQAMMPKEDEAAMEKESGEMMPAPNEAEGMKADLKPYYISYTEAQAGAARTEGRAVVYYFWASWCPICQAEEPKIKSWIENSGLPVAGFRVNYDTETALKAKYKIPYQHTTVFLNTEGEEVERFNGPVDEATFLAALKKAAQ